jgi:hypothetical protein
MIFHCEECGYECEYDNEESARDCSWWQDDNGNWYCEDCHNYCADCDQHFPSNELTYIERSERDVCSECLEDHYFFCNHCHCYEHNDYEYTVYRNGNEEFWCESCKQQEEENGNLRREDDYLIYEETSTMPGGHTYQHQLHPEVWQEILTCPDCLERRGKCPKCLRKEA